MIADTKPLGALEPDTHQHLIAYTQLPAMCRQLECQTGEGAPCAAPALGASCGREGR